MSHNISQNRRRLLEEERKRADLTPYLVPGWRLDSSFRIEPDPSVRGHLKRGQRVYFRCIRPDCRRRLDLDLEGACRARLGDETPDVLGHRFRCAHYAGCRLERLTEWPRGAPLIELMQRSDIAVQVTCDTCLLKSVLTARALIDRLRTTRRGDAATCVEDLPRALRGPCRNCKGRRFRTVLVPIG